jgi:hypothetical protein
MELASGEIVLDVAVSGVVETRDELSVESIHDLGEHLLVNRIDVTQDGFVHRAAVLIELTGDNTVLEMPFPGIAAPAYGG